MKKEFDLPISLSEQEWVSEITEIGRKKQKIPFV